MWFGCHLDVTRSVGCSVPMSHPWCLTLAATVPREQQIKAPKNSFMLRLCSKVPSAKLQLQQLQTFFIYSLFISLTFDARFVPGRFMPVLNLCDLFTVSLRFVVAKREKLLNDQKLCFSSFFVMGFLCFRCFYLCLVFGMQNHAGKCLRTTFNTCLT